MLRWLALALVLFAAPLRAQGWGEVFAPALAEAGLTPDEVRLDPQRWRGGGRLPLKAFEALWDDWREVAPWGEALGRRGVETPRLDALVRLGAEALDAPPAAPHLIHIDVEGVDTFVVALCALQAWLDAPLEGAALVEVERALEAVPPPVRRAAAEVLLAVPEAGTLVDQALAPWGERPATRHAAARAWAAYRDPGEEELGRLEQLDLAKLLAASELVASGVERAASILEAAPVGSASFHFTWDTPLGRIELCGADVSHHPARRTLLLIDAAGVDRHAQGASTSRGLAPVSVVIDAAGDDVYETGGEGAFGSGVLGIAIQADLAGDDRYEARAESLGFGALGAGLLLDVAGNDRYQVRHLGQAAAVGGVGLLLDRAGDDVYRCLQRSQAFAKTRGAALLVDLTGDDEYVAQDEVIVSPSPQTADHNTSLAQGCGFGRRAHPGDERSLAGGLGLLVDAAGDDTYRCGVFGQGTAYWYALGFLVDLAGNDTYLGAYYVQASAAHYAVAGLIDVAGNDVHRVSMAQSLGQGQDHSLSVLHDRAGDDTYESAGHCLGASILNGIGVFRDDAGDDTYVCGPSGTIGDPGQGAAPRAGVPAFGLFLDRGGGARFPADHPRARAGATWVVPGAGQHPRAIGVGRADQ